MSQAETSEGSNAHFGNPTTNVEEIAKDGVKKQGLESPEKTVQEASSPASNVAYEEAAPDVMRGEDGASRTVDAMSKELEETHISEQEHGSAEDTAKTVDASAEPSRIYDGIELLGAQSAEAPERDAPTPVHFSAKKSSSKMDPYMQTASRKVPAQEQVQAMSEPKSTITSLQEEVAPSKDQVTEETSDNDSRSEIQSIMEQFENLEEEQGPEISAASQDSPVYPPPRQSSLEPQHSGSPVSKSSHQFQAVNSPIRPPSIRNVSFAQMQRVSSNDPNAVSSPLQSPALNKALPPAPDPDPDLPFDFHRFLEQLRHRTADSVAKYLRSFLTEFGKKQWMVHEQVKIISDFLVFITNKMAQCEIWRGVSDAEFDNAREGMEKLVMNRLYSQTFSPAIPPPAPASPQKGKSKHQPRQSGPGRRGQHQEDIERDEVLAQKVRIYGWVREEHLDIAPVGKTGQRFLALAQQELLKIKSYRAPRDKVICVLNCCKVIFGLLRNSKEADTSADAFVPLLIYVILRANPEHLVSNVQYISRFRNPEKLGGEAGYYLSSLMGAIQFIENLDRTALTVSDEEFEKSVEAAVSAIAERKSLDMAPAELSAHTQLAPPRDPEKAERSPRSSSEQRSRPNLEGSSAPGIGGANDQTLGGGLLKTIQKPLTSIGRIFSEENTPSSNERSPHRSTNSMDGAPRLSPSVFQPPHRSSDTGAPASPKQAAPSSNTRAADAAARQASVETAEAQRIQRAEYQGVVETLVGMFPNLDRDVIADVVRLKEGRVGSAVDACLALNG